MKVFSSLCLLAVVAAVIAAPSDPAVLVPHVSPTAHSVSSVGASGNHGQPASTDEDEHALGGTRQTVVGSVAPSPVRGVFGSRPTRTVTLEDNHPVAASSSHDETSGSSATSRPHRQESSTRRGIPIPVVLRDDGQPSAQAQVGHPSLTAVTHGDAHNTEAVTEHDEEAHESSDEEEDSEHNSQALPSDTWAWPQASRTMSRRNFDFRPITFPRHDPPSFQPAPLSAAYTLNRVDQDAEEVPVEVGEGHPAPDLSRDTAVNFLPADRQGMVMVEPDAEIFDLNSVVEKSNALEFS